MTAWDTTTGDKATCRQVFLTAVAEHVAKPTEFFVLPSSDAHEVTLLKARWPNSRIRGVERDTNVFEHIQRTHFGVHVDRMSVRQFVDREIAHPSGVCFDAAFLDYTGICTPDNLRDVCAFVDAQTKDTFILGLTFHKATRGKKNDVRNVVMSHSWIEDDDLDQIEDMDSSDWNTPHYIADAVCGAIENGFRDIAAQR